jgi:hypothetical protein
MVRPRKQSLTGPNPKDSSFKKPDNAAKMYEKWRKSRDTYSMKRFTFYRLWARVVKQIFSTNYNKKPMLGAYFKD